MSEDFNGLRFVKVIIENDGAVCRTCVQRRKRRVTKIVKVYSVVVLQSAL